MERVERSNRDNRCGPEGFAKRVFAMEVIAEVAERFAATLGTTDSVDQQIAVGAHSADRLATADGVTR